MSARKTRKNDPWADYGYSRLYPEFERELEGRRRMYRAKPNGDTPSPASSPQRAERRVTNTAREAAENPMFMLGAMLGNPSRGIEEQERNGQAELVKSTQLPAKMRGPNFGIEREPYEKIGIVFGPASRDDDLFLPATLPTGWKKVGTDHSMWSKVVDDKGRERISIFYKAAFYDRDAHMSLTPRFQMNMDLNRDDYETVRDWRVLDGGKVVFNHVVTLPDDLKATLAKTPYDRDARQRRDDLDQAGRDACNAWLDKRYPNWKDVTAHWDDA